MSVLHDMGIQRWKRRVGDRDVLTAVDAKEVAQTQEAERNQFHAESIQEESTAIESPLDWRGLQAIISSDQHCPSCGRERSMLGEGNVLADWVFVYQSPTQQDLSSGVIPSGRSGQLYESMLAAIGQSRQTVYTTSVFKCIAHDDITVSPSCNDLLSNQLTLIQPKVIVAFGEFVAQQLLRSGHDLATMRSAEHHSPNGDTLIVPTHAPGQLLQDNQLKRAVWEDLKRALNFLAG